MFVYHRHLHVLTHSFPTRRCAELLLVDLGLGEAMFDRAAMLLLDVRQRLFPRAFPGDRAYGDLIEYLPARRVAEIAGENRRILGERDLRQPTAEDRFADIIGEFERALRPGVWLVGRSEGRLIGNEVGSRCRSRWLP